MKTLLAAVGLLALAACSSPTAVLVDYENTWDFYRTTYNDACTTPPFPSGCLAYGRAVNVFEVDLLRARYFGDPKLKVERAGKATEQFNQLKTDQKQAKKASKQVPYTPPKGAQ